MSTDIAARNLARAAWNYAAKLSRAVQRRTRRALKAASESAKDVRGQVRRRGADGRDTLQHAYSRTVKTARAWERVRRRAWGSATTELSVRRELQKAASGNLPIVVGPWLSEVGYEALYWVPFVRWFADHHRVDPERLVVVSRGGVADWYSDVAARYVELLDLFTPTEFAARNDERRSGGDQKQFVLAPFEREIVDRVRERLGLRDVHVCHPGTLFRLMRGFWLGTESLQRVLDHTRYRLLPPQTRTLCPDLPEDFVAVKLYTGRALPDSPSIRLALRSLIERVSGGRPIVALSTGLALDEHEDYIFHDLPRVTTLERWLTPQNNLGIQTEAIRRASLFVGTCGSLAWLAPMVGTDTMALYADDHLLAPHLYAARQVYAQIGAASFTAVDVRALETCV